MARPVLAAKGTVSVVTTNAPAPTYPTGVVANDILVLEVVKQDGTSSPTISTPAGWTLLDSVQQLDASFNAIGRISWFWIRTTGTLSGTLTLTTTGATGNTTVAAAQFYRITGCRTTGNPFDNFRSGVNTSQVSWQGDMSSGALHTWHAIEELTLCFAAGSGAGQTQPPVAPTGTQAISGVPADSSTSGADAFTLVYAVITEAEPSVGPYTSSTTRFGAGTLFINFVSASYVGQTLKSGTDTGSGADLGVGPKITVFEGGPVAGNSAKFAGTAINDTTSTGTANWVNASNVTADDGVTATLTINTETSKDLLSSNFGFAIPTGATIKGIVLEIGDFTASSIVSDLVVALSKDSSTLAGSNKATGLAIFSGTLTYGGATDLWGTTWTPAEINDSLFAAIFQINTGNASGVTVDFIRVTVYYTTVVSAATVTESGTVSTGGGSTAKSGTDTNGTTNEVTSQTAAESSTDVNGATTETSAITVPVAASDTNSTTTEAVTQIAVESSSDVSGTTTEAATLVNAESAADANATTTEAVALAAALTSADSGTDSEAGTISVPIAASDANSVTTEATKIGLSGADANGATTEAITQVAVETSADNNGATTETTKTNLAATDSNAVTTEQANETTVQSSTDANGVTTETGVLVALETTADTNSVTSEAASLRLNGSDVGTETDASTLVTQETAADVNAGVSEIATTNTPKSDTDANSTTTEAPTLLAKTTTTDSGTDSEAGSYTYALAAQADANAATTEAATPKAVETAADASGVTTESGSTSTQTQVTGTDAGTAQEAAQPAVALTGTDSSSSTQTAVLAALITSPDGSGSTIENALIVAQLVAAELGIASELTNLNVTVLSSDTGTAIIEAAKVGLIGVDAGSAVDAQATLVSIINTENGNALEAQVLLVHGRPVSPDAPHELLGVSMERAVLTGSGAPAATLVGAQAPPAGKVTGAIAAPAQAQIAKSTIDAILSGVSKPNG